VDLRRQFEGTGGCTERTFAPLVVVVYEAGEGHAEKPVLPVVDVLFLCHWAVLPCNTAISCRPMNSV
jgi:hypothetical protein